MKILYIPRAQTRKNFSLKKHLQKTILGYLLSGQDGFFEASLWTAFPDLDMLSFEQALKITHYIDSTYDWIIFNYKFFPKYQKIEDIDFSLLNSLRKCRKALFVNTANAHSLPKESIMDYFDVIFKRELLKDLDRYKIRTSTKNKLYVTMLSCPLIGAYVSKSKKVIVHKKPIVKDIGYFEHDLTFIGADNNPIRRLTLSKINQLPVDFYGGLYDRFTGLPSNWDGLKHQRLRRSLYIQTTAKSRINLALDGKGQFTYRHLDIWCLGSFMLSSASILDIQLPGINPQENVHFVCFRNYDELKEKIAYYLANSTERNKIALAGKKFFQSIYDFSKHGRYINDVLT